MRRRDTFEDSEAQRLEAQLQKAEPFMWVVIATCVASITVIVAKLVFAWLH